MANVTGILLALLSAIANGTFTIPSKLEPVRSSGTEPYVFNLYVGVGIGLSSLLVPYIFGVAVTFTWLGIVSGLFLSISSMNAFAAVKHLGVSAASGIWCGVAVVVSFFFGYFFEEPVGDLPLALTSLFALVASIFGIAYAERESSKEPEHIALLEAHDSILAKGFLEGVFAALIAGLFGGLILAPEIYAPADCSGVLFLFSFGIGTLLTSPLVNLSPYYLSASRPEFHFREAAFLGVVAGLIWSFQNVAAILAIEKIGYSIAYPVVQCGLFVAGLWGIFLFGEIQGPSQKYYWISGACLILGAIALNFSK